MLNLSGEKLANQNQLSEILSPVSLELSILEKKLIESVSSQNPFLDKISAYIIQAGGKKLRPAISFLMTKALNNGFVSANHFQLGLALELIHTATLIHDDVIDEADTRRGIQTINKLWDSKTAVIAGDFLLSKSLTKLAQVKNYSVIEIFANIMGEICEGEIQQNLQDSEIISIDAYIEKSRRKTAMLFVAGCECAAILSPGVDNLTAKSARDYAINLGIAFQIADDILNYTASREELGKPSRADFKNGILTAPVIFALQEYAEKNDKTLENIINKDELSDEDYQSAYELIISSKGIQWSVELAQKFVNEAKAAIDVLEDNSYKQSLIKILDYTVTRNF